MLVTPEQTASYAAMSDLHACSLIAWVCCKRQSQLSQQCVWSSVFGRRLNSTSADRLIAPHV